MKRSLLFGVLLLALTPLLATPPKSASVETFRGKVVPLADLIERSGGKLDADAAAVSMVLVSDDGKIYPLIKDSASRMFYRDRSLLNRPMQIMGRLFPGSSLLRVGAVNSLHKGELFDVYYWCDICSIKRGEKNICECCGGPMELKEDPVKR